MLRGRSSVMVDADMWGICAQAAVMLDDAGHDWQRLIEVEDTLWPLATRLAGSSAAERATSDASRHTQQAQAGISVLDSCLSWVHHHAYDAPESELQSKLDIALRSAMNTLDHLERSQYSPLNQEWN